MTYQQPITIATTANATMEDYVCTGSNDDSIFQKAIDRAETVGGEVFIKPGSYSISDSLDLEYVSLRGSGKGVTNLNWAGSGSKALFQKNRDVRGYIKHMTVDGNSDSDTIGFVPTASCASLLFEDIRWQNFGTAIKSGDGSGHVMFDCAFIENEFYGNDHHMDLYEYGINCYECKFEYSNDMAIVFNDNSNNQFFGGTFTNNEGDMYFAGSGQNISCHGTWFESSVQGILIADTDFKNPKNVSFHGCRLNTANATALMDLTYISANIPFFGCLFVQATGTNIDITRGTYSAVDYFGCTNQFSSGAVDNRPNVNRTVVNEAGTWWLWKYQTCSANNVIAVTYTPTGTVSIGLPTANLAYSNDIHIVDEGGNAGSNNITISTEGAETINGEDTYVINSNYGSVTLYSNGTNWLVKQ